MFHHHRAAFAAAAGEIVPPIASTRKNHEAHVAQPCTGIDSDIFYPSDEDEALADEAKAICAVCPVKTVCLDHALSIREKDGVWGGATEKERRRMLRQRRQSA